MKQRCCMQNCVKTKKEVKRCRPVNTENSESFVEHIITARRPTESSVKLFWGDEDKIVASFDAEAEAYLKKLRAERYQTNHQYYFNLERFEQAKNEQELDLGNQLVAFLNRLYNTPKVVHVKRPVYTSTRLFGFSNIKSLETPNSVYQDTYGRTGGEIIMKNLIKIIATKHKQRIREKIQEMITLRGSSWSNDFIFPIADEYNFKI